MTRLQINPSDWPQELVAEIARGMEDPADIAYRYGYTASKFKRLSENKAFIADVARVRADLEAGGYVIKTKAAWMTEQVLESAFLQANNPGTPLTQKLDFIKMTSKLGDLEPRNTVAAGQGGPGFSITINIPQITTSTKQVESNSSEVLRFPMFSKDKAIEVDAVEKPDDGK